MCWNENASILSFIIGTVVNISVMLYFKNTIVFPICIVWQWIIMMQLSEYFIWKSQKENSFEMTLGSRSALIFNLTQPLIVFLCLIMISNVKMSLKIVASLIIVIYISFMLVNINIQKEYKSLHPSPNCQHILLKWWTDIKGSGIIYVITLLAIILLLLRPFSLTIFIILYLLITILISIVFYSCGKASMWCLIVVPFPIFLGIFYSQFMTH